MAFASNVAQATTVNFLDTSVYFPGYPIRTGEGIIGNPQIASMDVTWSAATGYLEKVVINLTSPNIIRFDTLFINNDYRDGDSNWQNWDYIVHSGGNNVDQRSLNSIEDGLGDTATSRSNMIPGDGVYAVSETFNYTFVNDSGGRDGHPNGIDANGYLTKINPSNRSDLQGLHSNLTITYDFVGYQIHTGGTFAMAYAPWCANDIIIADSNGNPVPEPATMLLFGTGIAGLAGFRRMRRKYYSTQLHNLTQ